jgi:hypothetical protein
MKQLKQLSILLAGSRFGQSFSGFIRVESNADLLSFLHLD